MRSTRSSLPIALLRAREAVMVQFRPILVVHGLNEQQWRVMRVLDERGELDATELAKQAFVLAPSLTRMMRAMQFKKLLVSKSDKADRRRTLIQLTPKAQSLIKKIAPESELIYKKIDQELGAHRLTLLLEMLDDVATQIGDLTR